MANLPAMCARLREELDPDELRAKALIDAACAQIGVDARGSLIDPADTSSPKLSELVLFL